MKSMSILRPVALLPVLFTALSLAACTPEEIEADQVYVPNSGAEQFPIIVEKGPATLNIANNDSLTPGQVNAVSNFARIAVDGRTPVTVSKPAGASPRLAHEIGNLLAQQGVQPGMIRMASYRGASSGPIKVTVKKLHARTAPCGEWPEDLSRTQLNDLSYNHGCAVQSNIAAMVANPGDFVTSAPLDPPYATGSVAAIEALPDARTGASSSGSSSSSSSPSSGAP
jgi:pilus assembly protein CpaD